MLAELANLRIRECLLGDQIGHWNLNRLPNQRDFTEHPELTRQPWYIEVAGNRIIYGVTRKADPEVLVDQTWFPWSDDLLRLRPRLTPLRAVAVAFDDYNGDYFSGRRFIAEHVQGLRGEPQLRLTRALSLSAVSTTPGR